jgi:hypothetical protein
MLDIWPAMPLIIEGSFSKTRGVDNILAALKYSDRVCDISIQIYRPLDMESLLAAMQRPFPELTGLKLWWLVCFGETEVIPDSFLGGFAPHLETLLLQGILFPGLLKLLLSATHLVHLTLGNIPDSGYISPDAMVAALSTLTSLKTLSLSFTGNSPQSRPDLETRRLPPSTRSVLPALTELYFTGDSDYLEHLVTDIDAPQLNDLSIHFFFRDSVFDTPQLIRFISCTPMSSALENVDIDFYHSHGRGQASVTFRSQKEGYIKVEFVCRELDWLLSSLEQVCSSCLPFLSTLEDLHILDHIPKFSPPVKDIIENRVLWLELLHPFTAVKNLYISEKNARRIGPALQELVEGRATEVLPALENIFLQGLESSGRAQEGIERFVAARQSASHPIAISTWTG